MTKPKFDHAFPTLSGRTSLELKNLIDAAEAVLRDKGLLLAKLREDCAHPMEIISAKQWKAADGCIGAYCPVCSMGFGWRCRKSPDGVCHYESDEGLIELIDGRSVPIPAKHDPDYETSDSCIFCGAPDERK